MGRAAAVLIVIAIAACGGGGGDESPDAATGSDATPRPDPGVSLGTFTLTYYWVTAEDEFPGPADTALYDDSCAVLATVPSAFADDVDVEGTGRLADGRVINVSGGCGCPRSPCYFAVDAQHPWGYGVQNRALEPYRSIAVDPSAITYGTTLWIAELDGEPMPGDSPWGGFVHDGCAIAADTGGGIIGMHVDWFVGLRASYQTLDDRLGLGAVTVHDGGARCP